MLTRIAKYEVLRRLGQGAMGEVFLAKDPLIGREVAIKTISAAHAQGEEARERFLREARAAGTLSHPNLVTIHEFGEDHGLLYLVMEYVPGEDLHALIALKALQPKEILEVLAQVCDGLGFAHGKGVLHRDIKPSNIRVARPGGKLLAKVMDFGIARISGSDFTGTGTLLGTFGYMAPEYIQTGRPDTRSDLFAVGVILYEALAGDRPFKGDTTATVLYRIVHDPPPPLDPKVLEGVSPAVRGILAMALAKDPGDRFQGAEELARALRAATDPTWSGFGDGPVSPANQDDAPATVWLGTLPAAAAPARRTGGGWWIAAATLAAGATAAVLLWPRPRPAAAAAVLPGVQEPPPAARNVAAPPVEAAPLPGPAPKPVTRPDPPKPVAIAVAPEPPRPEVNSIDAAAAILDRDPKAALGFLDRFLGEDPRNARAWALKLAAHYELNDIEGFRAGLRTAHDLGVQRRALLVFPRFRAVLKQEAEQPKLPPRMRELLFEGLPVPGAEDPPRKRPPFRRPRFQAP